MSFNPFKIAALGGIGVLVIAVGSCSMEQVNTGHRGIYVTYGKPTAQTDEGLKFFNPFTTELIELDVRQLKWSDETQAYTKDVQQANVAFSLTYSLNPMAVMKTYQTVGTEWAGQIVPQVVEQSIKDVFGQSEAVKDTINNRSMVQQRIRAELIKNLKAKDVIVHGFELRDISFSKAFEQAVEAKQVAVENANAARNKTVQVQEEANQRIIAAKADAEAMQIKTRALAGNSKLVEYEAVRKWDGRMPETMIGNSTPFINLGKK